MNYIYTNYFEAGSGNQLFVYFYGKIFSNKFNIPYYHPGIPSLNIEPNLLLKKNSLKTKQIKYFIKELNSLDSNVNYLIQYSFNPTIENFHIFKPYINFLKSIFPIKNNNIDKDDLVYHFRAGDYFFDNNHYLLNGNKLNNVISNITHKQLYVVTNLTKKQPWSLDEYKEYRNEYLKHGEHTKPYKENQCVQPNKFNEVLSHINGVIDVLNKHNCIWISDTVYEDFNMLRNFNKIIINVSTLSWWAAVLSDAKEVYAPVRWKWKKGVKNKNLPNINLSGWTLVEL